MGSGRYFVYMLEGHHNLMEVDLLIGSDCCSIWWLTIGETRGDEEGHVAIHTQLGWVLSGMLLIEEGCSIAHNFVTTYIEN